MLARTRAKMTKLEELKAAYGAATPGEWETNQDVDITSGVKFVATALYPDSEVATQIEYNNADFIALAHNLMPQLLEAIDLLETVSSARACQDHEFDVDAWFKQVRRLLGNLK